MSNLKIRGWVSVGIKNEHNRCDAELIQIAGARQTNKNAKKSH